MKIGRYVSIMKIFNVIIAFGIIVTPFIFSSESVSANTLDSRLNEADLSIQIDFEKDRKEFEKEMRLLELKAKELNIDIDKLEGLTDVDLNLIYDIAEDEKKGDENISNQELEIFILEEMEKVNEGGKITPFSTYFGYTLNTKELLVCATNPIDCTNAYRAKNEAEEATPDLYSSGFHNGNADAFRHAYWNARMAARMPVSEAKKFADAHEYGATNQPKIEEQMDLYNNAVGRGYSTYSKYAVSSRVSLGYLKRIVGGKLVSTNSSGIKPLVIK